MNDRITRDHRLGRCANCSARPVWAWHRDTGLRLDDVRCPRCGDRLDRSSREAHDIRLITEYEADRQQQMALRRLHAEAASAGDYVLHWMSLRNGYEAGSTLEFQASLSLDSWQERLKQADAGIRRINRAVEKAAA